MYVTGDRSKVPQSPHFQILVFGSIYVPGDERSRTNPGHGYPASNEPTISLQVFTLNQHAEFEAEVARLERNKERYVAQRVEPFNVKVNVSLTLE